jgi:hypothetical protein
LLVEGYGYAILAVTRARRSEIHLLEERTKEREIFKRFTYSSTLRFLLLLPVLFFVLIFTCCWNLWDEEGKEKACDDDDGREVQVLVEV